MPSYWTHMPASQVGGTLIGDLRYQCGHEHEDKQAARLCLLDFLGWDPDAVERRVMQVHTPPLVAALPRHLAAEVLPLPEPDTWHRVRIWADDDPPEEPLVDEVCNYMRAQALVRRIRRHALTAGLNVVVQIDDSEQPASR